MSKSIKKIMSIVLCFFIAINTPIVVNASENVDQFLINKGVPETVLRQMSMQQKEYIYQTIDPNSVFENYENKDQIFNDNLCRTIPTSELGLSVISFKVSGTNDYEIYPSFKWYKNNIVNNDTFAFYLPDGWDVVISKRQLCLWAKNIYGPGQHQSVLYETPSIATFGGYGWKFPYNGDKISYTYEGNAYMRATKKNTSALNKIRIGYCDTKSISVSYSINLSFFGLSVSLGSNDYRLVEDVFDLNVQ